MDILYLLVYSVIGVFVASLVHELGHLLVSLSHGWHFNFLVAGPFRWEASGENKRVRLSLERNPALWGGVVSCIPDSNDSNSFNVFNRVLIGGPLLSIILGFVLFMCFIFTKNLSLLVFGEAT